MILGMQINEELWKKMQIIWKNFQDIVTRMKRSTYWKFRNFHQQISLMQSNAILVPKKIKLVTSIG